MTGYPANVLLLATIDSLLNFVCNWSSESYGFSVQVQVQVSELNLAELDVWEALLYFDVCRLKHVIIDSNENYI